MGIRENISVVSMRFVTAGLLSLLILIAGCAYTINPQDLSLNTGQVTNNTNGYDSNSLSSNPQGPSGQQGLVLSAQEVAKHNTFSDCWMIINGIVYNVSYFSSHPGGQVYAPYCGKDATAAFTGQAGLHAHSQAATAMLAQFELGSLNQTLAGLPQDNNSQNPSNGPAQGSGSPSSGTGSGIVLPPSGPGQVTQPPANPGVLLTPAEVAKHSTLSDCWMIISGKVYNVSNFSSHPGGEAYAPYCGTDATAAFTGQLGGHTHSQNAYSWLPQFEVGTLNQNAAGLGIDSNMQTQAANNGPVGTGGRNGRGNNGGENEYGDD